MKKSEVSLKKVREPVFAGKFYPSSQKLLSRQLVKLFDRARKPVDTTPPQAIIAPHAGYIFSGGVAASAYNQIPEGASYKRVFILASSHQYAFGGASICNASCYKTPLGEVGLDRRVTRHLMESGRFFHYHPEAHQYEHSLEVQLPFLQHKLKGEFQLVPVVLGTHEAEECEKIALLLEPWFHPENLFVISTDFSHYPAYEDAVENDFNTAHAICSNNPGILLESLRRSRPIENLATSLCGWTSVMTLLYLTQHKNMQYRLIHYQNSGDAQNYGEKDRVVGYWAISVAEKYTIQSLAPEIRKELLEKARQAIALYLETGRYFVPVPPKEIENKAAGMFVSIYVNNELRGCTGNLTTHLSLREEVEHLAVSSICDQRFEHLKKEELDDLELEISLLSPLRRIASIKEIQLGKHGIYMKKGARSGTFLPKVAEKTGWSLDEFLGHCARDKAGIGWDGWKDAELYVYEAIVFRG